jgi:WD40 repeat protein/serine/threonine protein kinase
MDDLTHRVIKGYELRQMVGAGGFGAVYRAYQLQVGREVALKIILPSYANQPEFIRRFEAEAQLVARLEHFHIVPLYDYWREPDGAYLVMRWLRGGSLRSLIDMGPLAIPVIARVLDQVAAALEVAHRSGVIHRDIKPDNILLDEAGNAYLVDFGIAFDLLKSPDTTRKHESFGSPGYASPEHILGQSFTPQMDIYSLGIVLFELLTGQRPFTSDDHVVLMRQHLSDPIPSLQILRPDLPSGLNAVIWRATAKTAQARFPSAVELAANFRQALQLGDGQTSPPPIITPNVSRSVSTKLDTVIIVAPPSEPSNPYKGLRPFQEADAGDFFGREKLIEQLLSRLSTRPAKAADDITTRIFSEPLVEESEPVRVVRFMAVVGPSGSGKSSVVKAGLIPALRHGMLPNSEKWFLAQMVPGSNPFEELAAALLRIAANAPPNLLNRLRQDERGLTEIIQLILPADNTELLLFIDQFEEVFTLSADEEERTRFLNALLTAVTDSKSRLRLVLTLRADFYDRPLLYPGFGDLVREFTEVVLPLSSSELARAINGPADRVGLTLERGLAAAIVAEVNKQPGALPLLQFALTELFEHRAGRILPLSAYQTVGGVSGALARRADELYESLDEKSKAAARQILLRLVTSSEGAEDTRRRVLHSELVSIGDNPEIMEQVIESFGKYRLFTFDREPATRAQTVELAHEALIREWKQFRSWLDSSRDELRLHLRLSAACIEWLNTRRDNSYLASGARLTQFETLAHSQSLALNAEESEYLNASLDLRRRQANRGRLFIAGLVVVALLALGLALFALDRERTALVERDRADSQARIAGSRALAVTALTNENQLDLALLLSLEALNTADTFAARNSLLTTLQYRPRLAQYLHGHTDRVRTVAFSPDGRLIASGSGDNMVILWDTVRGTQLLPPLQGHTGAVNSVAFSPDGQILASGSADGTIRLWNTESGAALGEALEGHSDAVWSVAFSPDGQTVASSSADNTVRLWDISTGEAIGEPLEGHTDIVFSVAFSPDGGLLASGGADNTVRLWDVETGGAVGEPLEGHTNWVLSLAFNADGLLASSGADDTVWLWNTDSGEALFNFPTNHADWVRSISFDPTGQILATGSADSTARLWDILTGQEIGQPLIGHIGEIWGVAFSPDGTLLASASSDLTTSEDNTIRLWNVTPDYETLGRLITGHTEIVASVAFSPDGTLLASASGDSAINEDNTIRFWDVVTGTQVALLEGHGGPVTSIVFSPDGQRLGSASADQTVMLWNVAGRQLIMPLIGHQNAVFTVAFSPDGKMLASGGDDSSVILWDAETGEMIGEPLTGHSDGVFSVAFSPDGTLVASGSRDGTVILWDVSEHQQIGEALTAHRDAVTSVVFSPDGLALASGSRDATIILWDVATRQRIGQPLTGHTFYVQSLAFSPNGKLLASGSADNTTRLWDLEEGQPLGEPFAGHTDWVNAVAFSPDGATIASGSRDTSLILWDVSLESWQAQACVIANRNLSMQEWERFLPGIAYRETCLRSS